MPTPLYKGFNPWDRVATAAALHELLPDGTVEAAAGTQELASPGDFWDVVLGTGYRGTVEALDENAVAELRQDILEHNVTRIRTDVLYGQARKPK